MQKSEIDVTVIVPVYKVEKFIRKCANSIFSQDLKKLEIIFIDDCSPDKSIAIIEDELDKFPERKSNTRFIKMSSNSGQAAVRRHGIKEARGKYVIHCDGDDWIDTDLYRSLFERAESTDADIVCCDYIYEERGGGKRIKYLLPSNDGKCIIEELYHHPLHLSCCNKLVKSEIYTANNIMPWDGLNMWEDTGLMFRLFYFAKKIEYVSTVAYHYNKLNSQAMTAAYGEKQVAQMIEIAKRITEFYSTKPDYERFEKSLKALQFYARINLVTDRFDKLSEYKATYPKCVDIIPYLSSDAFSKKGIIRFRMVKYHLTWLFILLFKLRNLILKLKKTR